MTNDEILQAAKEAGFNYAYASMWQDELERFVAIIEKRTIERCAVVCEGQYPYSVFHTDVLAAKNCAAAIRKLGEQ